jgi:hypothetical protein
MVGSLPSRRPRSTMDGNECRWRPVTSGWAMGTNLSPPLTGRIVDLDENDYLFDRGPMRLRLLRITPTRSEPGWDLIDAVAVGTCADMGIRTLMVRHRALLAGHPNASLINETCALTTLGRRSACPSPTIRHIPHGTMGHGRNQPR